MPSDGSDRGGISRGEEDAAFVGSSDISSAIETDG
jgi:hypothetical protein